MGKLFSSPQAGAHIVATTVVVGFVALVIFLAIHQVEATAILKQVADTLGVCFVSVVQYYMGSSKSSQDKSAQIDHLIGRAAAPGVPPQPGA